MDTKLFVTLRTPQDAQTVRDSGSQVLAEYPNALLIRSTPAQQAALQAAGISAAELAQPAIQVAGASFELGDVLAAETAAPTVADPNRTTYYLVQLIGPVKGEWLEAIRAHGGTIEGNLPGFVVLVGILPAAVPKLQAEPWVEAITPYRPAMKVSSKLRPDTGNVLSAADLAAIDLSAADPNAREQIEISVFPKESTADIAALVRAANGTVLEETPHTVIAVVSPSTITTLAAQPGVEAIIAHRFSELQNDRATAVMGAPVDRVFGDLTLRGTGQIVAIADTGLDTGVAATVHADFNGRVAGIVSFPITPPLQPYTNDGPLFDDGPADQFIGHGTHVAGSVLGNGAAASAVASPSVPMGMAPEAQVYFQAVEQRVHWKTAAQLAASGLAPFQTPWPPAAVGLLGLPSSLTNLFDPAYIAGARIHTNSWGASSAAVHGVYNTNARTVDNYMWNHRDILILFSAGNDGVDTNSDAIIDTDSIGPPATAKNCLTVGASENDRPHGSTPTPGLDANWTAVTFGGGVSYPALGAAGHISDNPNGMAAFSSRGPTDDGRIKPDVVAPGTNVLSVRSSVYVGPPAHPLWGDVPAPDPLHNLYCWSGGTSMSTPLVAGAAALIRQHLVQQRGHFLPNVKPSGALIKAFLVNGAASIPGQFPNEIPAGQQNTVDGFGRVNVAGSLTPSALQQTLFADDPDLAVATGELRTFEVQALDLAQPLKVTLVWTDAPSPVNIGGLQNQLYLQIVPPGAAAINGDVSAFPTASNNVQQVVIATPVAGTYEIRVSGVSVIQHSPVVPVGPSPRQDFALAVSNAMGLSVQPVSIAQAIDTTGSMDFFGYMEPAKERAAQLLDFLRGGDKVSITEFSQRAAVPPARTPYPLHLLTSFSPDWTDGHTAIGGLHAEGNTPIGAGLLEAWSQLQLEPVARPRAIILLSDGLENVAPFADSTLLAMIPSDVPIFTVALGPAGSAPTLQNIANSRPNGGYHVVASDDDIHKLHEIYAQLQALAAGAAIIGLSSAQVSSEESAEHTLVVDADVSEVTFCLSWDGAQQKLDFAVTGPDGRSYTATTAATLVRAGATYGIVSVGLPMAGVWKIAVRNAKSERPVTYTLSGAVRSSLTLVAEVTRVSIDQLSLLARLRHAGKPLDEAEVVARITLPTLSLQDVIAQFGDKIRQTPLPKSVDESELSEQARLLLQLNVFATGFRGTEGGLFERSSFEVKLIPHGNGEWTTQVPLKVPGNVAVEVIARGTIKDVPWERFAGLSAQVASPEAFPPRPNGVKITEIFMRSSKLWRYRIIGARVSKSDGQPLRPQDGVKIRMIVAQNDHKAAIEAVPYYSAGRYYIWRFAEPNFTHGSATVTVQATLGDAVVVDSTAVKL